MELQASRYFDQLKEDLRMIRGQEPLSIASTAEPIAVQAMYLITYSAKLKNLLAPDMNLTERVRLSDLKTGIGRAAFAMIAAGYEYGNMPGGSVTCSSAEVFFSYTPERIRKSGSALVLQQDGIPVGLMKKYAGEKTILGIAPDTASNPAIYPGSIVEPSPELLAAIEPETTPGTISYVDIDQILPKKHTGLFTAVRASAFTDNEARKIFNTDLDMPALPTLDDIRDRICAAA